MLTAPTGLVATADSSSQITISWGSVVGAASYTIQYATNSTFTSATTLAGVAATGKVVTGLQAGQRYYFRVYAVSLFMTSPASASVSAVTTINTPSAPIVTQSTVGATTTYSWPPVACPSGTTARYQYQRSTEATTYAWTATAALSVNVTTSNQGWQYTTEVQAQCYTANTTSSWSASDQASYITPVQPSGAISYTIARNALNTGIILTATSACSGGTSLYSGVDAYTAANSSPGIIWANTVAGTSPVGWYADSHNGVWNRPTWSNYGNPINVGVTNPGSTQIPSGAQFKLAVNFRCQNSTTGRYSAETGRQESGVLVTP